MIKRTKKKDKEYRVERTLYYILAIYLYIIYTI